MRVEDEDTESGEQEPENDMDSGKMDAYELENESDACETGDKRECTSRIGTLKFFFVESFVERFHLFIFKSSPIPTY